MSHFTWRSFLTLHLYLTHHAMAFYFINHLCWPFTARGKYSNQGSTTTPPQFSGFWPGQNGRLHDYCRKKGSILTPNIWPYFTVSYLFISAAPPFGKKAYFHLWALDVNPGSTTFKLSEINMNLNVHLKQFSFLNQNASWILFNLIKINK